MAWQALAGAGISALGSAFGGGGSSKPPKWLRRSSKWAVDRAQQLAQRPYTAFSGERVAPLSANEQQASSIAGTFGARTQPFLGRLSQGFSPGALDQYANPYLDRVLGARRRVIGEEYTRQAGELGRRQSTMDAYRTGRSALERSRLEYNRMRALSDAEAEGQAGAFDRAMDAYARDRGLDIGALGATTQATEAEVGALSRTGATERSLSQAQRDFDYGQFIEGRDWSVNNMGPLLDAIRAASGAAGTTTTQGNTGSAMAGVLGTILSNWGKT